MKMLETLTTAQKISLLNGTTVGMFPYIVTEQDAFAADAYPLCLGYYTQRSGEKTISFMYERFRKLVTDNPTITSSPEQLMGQYIRSKYISKWQLEYNLLLATQYNPLDEYAEERSVTEDTTDETTYDTDTSNTGTDTDTLTYNTNLARTGTDTDTISQTEALSKSGTDTVTKTFDTSLEDTGEKGTSLSEERTDTRANNIYGFNSQSAVGDTNGHGRSEVITQGNAEDNTTHNVELKTGDETEETDYDNKQILRNDETNEKTLDLNDAKTGTETHAIVHGKTESKSGTDTRDLDRQIDTDTTGRRTAASELLDKELDFRNRQIFYDIVYRDIDSIATLQIYI